MPYSDQPKPVVRIDGVMRGELETFDSRPDSNGVVRRLGRATVLTDEGGFADVLVLAEQLPQVPVRGPVQVSWLCEVYAYSDKLMQGTGENRRPFNDANGHPVSRARLALTLSRIIEADEAATPIRSRKTA